MRLKLKRQIFIKFIVILGLIYVVYLIFHTNDSSDDKKYANKNKQNEESILDPDPVPNKIRIEEKKEEVERLNKAYDDLEV
jgi:hypothetical protein